MNDCDMCEFYGNCELAGQTMFCDDCKDYHNCSIKFVTCEAGHYIECNNGWEDKEDYCCQERDGR